MHQGVASPTGARSGRPGENSDVTVSGDTELAARFLDTVNVI
ncbi:hypothetical protein [Streptomyces coeruleorubidus]